MKIQCLEVAPELSEGWIYEGTLVLESQADEEDGISFDIHLLDMATGHTAQMPRESEKLVYAEVSPDGKWVAFRADVFEEGQGQKPIERKLVVANAVGERQIELPWEEGWVNLLGWLGDDRLVIYISGLEPGEDARTKPDTLLAVNPFTGERQILQTDFPQRFHESPLPVSEQWGITYYDPTLTYVAYLWELEDTGLRTWAIWDLQQQKLIVKPPLVVRNPIPRWSPNGSQFLLVGLAEEMVPGELYSIHVNGAIEQLTNLRPSYPDVNILNYGWSPDGRSVAVWMNLWFDRLVEPSRSQLAVLDMETMQITNTCVEVTYADLSGEGWDDVYGHNYPPTPIWSPDGKQVVVVDWYNIDHQRVILIDLERNFAAVIAEDMEPMGWMVNN